MVQVKLNFAVLFFCGGERRGERGRELEKGRDNDVFVNFALVMNFVQILLIFSVWCACVYVCVVCLCRLSVFLSVCLSVLFVFLS
jgi:hypothetical protein